MRLHPGLVILALCVSQTALAQKVVVLEFEGDKGGKLQKQVEAAVKKAKVLDVVPLAKWKDAAAKKKLKGAQAMTPSAVARVASSVGIDAAVEGALGDTFFVRILDKEGSELWSKDLPLKKGAISDDHAKKLSKAIAAAAKTAKDKPEAEAKPEPEPDKPVKKPKKEKPEETAGSEEGGEEGGEEAAPEPATRRPANAAGDRARAEEEAEAQAAMSSQQSGPEPEKDADLEEETRKKSNIVRPRVVTLTLAGTTTGRSYCSRPGVSTCEEYDALPENERAIGDTVDFSADVPYAGFSVVAEVFPLSTVWEKLAGFGFGLKLNFALGFSQITIRTQTPTGPTQEQVVISTDLDWGVQLVVPRWHFALGDFKFRGISYIDLRIGLGGRRFQIDDTANVPLPGPDRTYLQFGADIRFAPVKFIGLDLSLSIFADPKPGNTVIFGYGDLNGDNGGAASSGFSLEGGLSGELFGPLGYSIHGRYTNYVDNFIGQGKKWITPCDSTTSRCGGTDREQYLQLIWGLSLGF